MYRTKFKYNRALKDYSRKNRKNSTEAEKVFWEMVRKKQIEGIKFQRQFPMYAVIFDFYADEIGLVVEIDGSIHNEFEQKEWDRIKENYIRENQMDIIRFKNEEVINNIEVVKKKLKEKIREIKSKKEK